MKASRSLRLVWLLGIAGAAAVTRLLSSRLFGVTPLDITTFAIAGVTLMAVAACASLIPAIERRTDRSHEGPSR